MELEQRVKTLEYEIKILKNEIQRTLLDIHEQVLIHYYPTLRLEESQVPATVIQAVEAARAKQPARPEPAAPVAPPAPPAATAAPLVAPAPLPVVPAEPAPLPDAPMPSVKRVTLNDIRAARTDATAAPPSGSPQANLIKLVEWAVNGATKFGNDRAIQLIDVLALKGIVDRATKNALFQVVSLNKNAGPEKIVINDLLDELLKLDKLLGRAADAEEALTLIEEAKLG